MKNEYEIRGAVTVVVINNKGSRVECFIDTDCLERTKEFPNTWFAVRCPSRKKFYVCGTLTADGKRRTIYLHRWLSGIGPEWNEYEIDHIDHDALNNRMKNLRFATRAQNLQNRTIQSNNTTGFRGVSFHKETQKFQATFYHNKKMLYLGLFTSPEEASEAVKNKRKELMPFSKEGMGVEECVL